MEKLVILGSGIGGCTAAIYAARAELSPLVLSGPEEGGQLMWTTEIENFPGFPNGIPGVTLVENAKKQAQRFGARFDYGTVNKVQPLKNGFELELDDKKIKTQTLIIVTGASAKWLGLPSEEKYKGRGVSVCATCDGAFYKNKEVLVIGGGDTAMEEATFLAKVCSKVTIVYRKNEFRASKIMQEKVLKNSKIKVIWNTEIAEILGDGKKLTGVKLKNTQTSKLTELKCDGVFVAIGHLPNTTAFASLLELNEQGYIKTDRFMNTNVPGIFAAGDVQDVRFRQAITAAGSGCMAAMMAERYLAEKEGH